MDHDVVGIALSVSAILSGANAFLLGFYLSEYSRGTPMDKISIFKKLVIVIAIPSLLIGFLLIIMIACTTSNVPNDLVLIISAIASMVPSAAFLILLAIRE